jgi:hypothetical protein
MIYKTGAYYDRIKIFNKLAEYTAESVFRKKMFYIESEVVLNGKSLLLN